MKYATFFFISVMLATTGCRKDKPVVDDPIADVVLNIDHRVGGLPFYMDSVYTDDFGSDYKFSRAQVYLSNFNLGGVSLNEYLLVDTETADYGIGGVEAGHYHDLVLHLGVDSVTNHGNPAQYSLDHPLALKTPSTHWGWNSGYLFIILEGEIDTTGDGTMDDNFIFHIGGDMHYVNTSLTVHQDVPSEGEVKMNIQMDWGAFFSGLDLKSDYITHTMDNMPLAASVVNNIGNVFSIN